ncbi:TonB-dependent receptor plug domain-containing protein [Alloyangia pacifica]|uniref:TonB-dependent receptor plug domain-containing protein n=1 Tax=Alloyangia pacifica TaxID=311180 RepID=UPI001CD1D4F7|nr:TonB-dependent receptor [Alloyangia pacifica]MCA0996212.1 TonB-dependent receptor [Alloyangia pacifica]
MKRPILFGLRAATALAAASLSGAAYAQEGYDLGTITLSANRGESTELERSGATVEVVTKEDLEKTGETRVADYLASLPGISVTTNGGIGTNTTLRIRGASGQYIGVYIDGINVNDPSGTQIEYDFGALTTADVSRIEVLKGSQSALYGSEAIAGVINITTARPTEPGLSQNVAAEYGSYNTRKLSYNLGYLGERGSFATTLSRVETDGFSAADEDDGNDEADSHESTRLSFSGDYALTDTVTLGASGFWQKTETEYDESYPVLADGTHDEVSKSEQYGLRGFARIDAGALSHELSLQYFENDRSTSSNGYDYPFYGQRWTLGYQGQAELSATTLTFGADATREQYENDGDEGDQDTYGIWAQANWHLSDQIELVTALRHDDHSDFGGKTTGRVSLAYLPSDDVTLRASVGTGFRAPSLYERYNAYAGNPDLEPETSLSYELGAEKRFEGGKITATLFRTEITDLIEYNYNTWAYSQVEGTSWMQGVELSGETQITDRLGLAAAYTWTDTEDAETGDRLTRVPLHDLALTLDAAFTDDFSGAFRVRHVAGVEDTNDSLPDYTVADVNFRYALSDNAELYLRVENLFDEDYQTVTGYGTSDRAAYFGVRGSF